MAEANYRGVERTEELRSSDIRPDTRSSLSRARAYFATTDGVFVAMIWLQAIGLFTIFVPFSGEIVLLVGALFYQLYVNPGHTDPDRTTVIGGVNRIEGKHRVYDFPYRVPFSAKRFDGSYSVPKLGSGITFLGKEISTKLEIWSGDSDLRTHMLVLGTTGSGKTELLLGLVFNALVQNSGFIYTDGKGDVSLWNNVFRLARYLGRECDLLLVNFLTSGRDFIDKQFDRTTNTMNPFALGSSGMLIELIIALMDDSGGGGDMWKGRAIAFVAGLTRVLCYLRDRGYILLDSSKFIEFMELPVVEAVVFDKKITVDGKDIKIDDPLFETVCKPLRAFVLTLPGYTQSKKGNQDQKTMEQHGFITMQLTRLFGDLSFTYGYIFQTLLGEVDMYDVVINRRILAVLLPALERAPDSLKMLGKLIVGAIKQMMAGCLGNRVEGSVREIVEARPTNAAVPFYVVLDEYGYYAVLGFAVAPAQARSLGFPQPERALVRMANGQTQRMGDMRVGEMIRSPDGAQVRVREVLEHDSLPVAKITLESGKAIEAAYVHHWPVRVMYQQTLLKTTQEIDVLVKSGVTVELSIAKEDGLQWEEITDVSMVGVEKCRCLVVEHDLHCYLTDHDVVTHNCITFAAQDFSSLQKASKEEADATWENTNVRAIGRVTSGQESETFRRIKGVAGEAVVYENGYKEHSESAFFKWRTKLDARINRVQRIEFDDIAHQQDGEFTFLVGKKDGKGSGGVRIIRARGFYTGVKEKPPEIRINHFLKVEPPRTGGGEVDLERLDAIEKLLGDMMKNGDLKAVFPDNREALLQSNQPFYKLSEYMRAARTQHQLSLAESLRVAFVCEDQEMEVKASATGAELGMQAEDAQLRASVEAVEQIQSVELGSESLALQEPVEDDSLSIPLTEEIGSVALSSDDAVGQPTANAEDLMVVPLDDASEDVEPGVTAGLSGKAIADKAGSGGEAGGASGGTSSGGMAAALTPPTKPQPVHEDESTPEPVKTAKSQIADFLDGYDYGRREEEAAAEEAAGGAQAGDAAGPRARVSALTLRVLNEEEAPNEIESYLADAIETTNVALGISKDSLESKASARRAVQELERVTSYVDGATPESVTLEGWDATIDDLENAAAQNPPNYL
ncbi:type IV secretory system conjugative DNA transfer family protein [Ralstonia sp. ASV6]|uniref:type IV secretory system conjugative DNA transfer family protein n=1 Tax=Ralstonia sp. ASV6 TaxID=2795124 RepID=UPI001E2F5C87|nr:type IV secretory system conjugative DNA transfer family protein [Ralstonia sp. ASV6]